MHTTKSCFRRLLLSLILCPVFFGAFAFDRDLSGRITDNEGRPLEGASVMVKNTKTGTTTDATGHFRLSVPDNASTLIISIMGFSTKEVSIASKSVINVTLESAASSLGDVVVVGYGTQKRSDLTGAVSTVKGSDLTKLPTQRVDQALQGRATGVMVQNTDGSPGGNTTIRIRGGNSIIGSNDALIVVDGIQGVNINTINPNDIESLEVLKDASATAIYGARGANGVILITTKRGATGAPSINYGYSLGTQSLSHKLALMNAGQYARKSNDWAASQTGTVSAPITPVLPFTDDQIAALDKSGGTDWQDVLYRSAGTQNHQLSISGGSENARYFVSAGYLNQHGIIVGTNYQRYNLRSNLDLKVNKWLNAGINLNVIKDKGNVAPVGEGTEYGDILGQVVNTIPRFDPITPIYDSAGHYNFRALKAGPNNNKTYADPDVWNPLATALETKTDNSNTKNEISTFLEFKILDGLTLRVTGAATVTSLDQRHYYNTQTFPGMGVNGLGDLTSSKTEYYQNSNILTYNKTFNQKHHLILTGVAEQQLIQSKGVYINAQNFFNDLTGINDLSGANQINQKVSTSPKQTLNSFLGRVNYTFDEKYMVTASFRADGSSVFGANHKWGYFPSAAVAWRVSEEDFMKTVTFFSTLKLRASWGKTGNQAIQPYQSLATLATREGGYYPYYGTSPANIGFFLTSPGNPDLKWETTQQTNLGVDMGFFKDRLTATIDVYQKKTTDLLMNKQVETYTGFSTVLANVGSIQNRGLEISLGGKPLAGPGLKWFTNVNISFNRGKVLALQNDLPLPIKTNTGGGYNIWKQSAWSLKNLQVGQPIDQMRGYVNLGTWKTSEADAAKAMGQVPGEAKWKDVNHDGKINIDDGNEVIGNAVPKFIYGWNNTFSYKNFDLSFLIQGNYGNDIFNAVRIKTESGQYGLGANLVNRWTPDHQNTNVPGFINTMERSALNLGSDQTATIGADTRSSRWVENGSYLRMKNITLTYSLPTPLISRIHFTRVSFYATAINLFTITKYTGYDPEVSSYNLVAGGLGIDLSNYPTSKTFLVGVNLGF